MTTLQSGYGVWTIKLQKDIALSLAYADFFADFKQLWDHYTSSFIC